MTAYDVSEWTELFVAAAGAAAALAGLVFVAVSINVERILQLPGAANRALQALIQLIAVVLVSLLVLAPGQSGEALGIEIVVVMLAVSGASFRLVRPAGEGSEHGFGGFAGREAVVAMGTVPGVIGGLSLIAGDGGGFYWLLAWMVLAVAGAVLNAWVQLVEILR